MIYCPVCYISDNLQTLRLGTLDMQMETLMVFQTDAKGHIEYYICIVIISHKYINDYFS